MTNLLERPFTEVSVTAGEYASECASAIDARDGAIHAFLHVGREESGTIPFAVKDNIVTRTMPTTCASRVLEGFVAPYDATAVERLRAWGGRLIGKTNLDEFAMGSSTEHSAFGATSNPWDLSRVAGGSSGGSAAAVAARMVPVALGSETGGSVRQPAAFCGVVGVKPTYGRVSRRGLVAFASSLDQIGVVTKTVGESAVILGVIAGHDPRDATSSLEPVADYMATIDDGLAGARVGVISEALEQLTGEVRENFDAALDVLRTAGAIVEEVSIPTLPYAIAIYYVVANAEASANLARFDGVRFGLRAGKSETLHDLYVRTRAAGFGDEVQRRIMLGTFVLSSGHAEAYYARAQAVRRQMRHDFDSAFSRFDFLVTPTSPEPAFELGARTSDPLSMYLSDIFTAPANLVGIPAIAVPSGFDRRGLPLSLQIMAPHFREASMFRAARAFETGTGYWRRVPVMPPS